MDLKLLYKVLNKDQRKLYDELDLEKQNKEKINKKKQLRQHKEEAMYYFIIYFFMLSLANIYIYITAI